MEGKIHILRVWMKRHLRRLKNINNVAGRCNVRSTELTARRDSFEILTIHVPSLFGWSALANGLTLLPVLDAYFVILLRRWKKKRPALRCSSMVTIVLSLSKISALPLATLPALMQERRWRGQKHAQQVFSLLFNSQHHQHSGRECTQLHSADRGQKHARSPERGLPPVRSRWPGTVPKLEQPGVLKRACFAKSLQNSWVVALSPRFILHPISNWIHFVFPSCLHGACCMCCFHGMEYYVSCCGNGSNQSNPRLSALKRKPTFFWRGSIGCVIIIVSPQR